MVGLNITSDVLQTFTVTEAIGILTPLLMFISGVVLYAIFIFKFYRFLAKRDVFKLNLEKYNSSGAKYISSVFYVIKYMIIFPILTFVWFLALSVLLIFLSKSQSLNNILLVSIALVASIRITAYYEEDLSRDLAKMLPFALLGVFLVDISFFSFSESLAVLLQIPTQLRVMAYYLVFVIVLEFLLRISHGLFGSKKVKKNEEST